MKLSAQDWLADDGVCTLGSLQVCISVNVVSSGSDHLEFTVTNQPANWAMALPFGITSQTHVVTAIGFHHLGSNWSGTVSGLQAWDNNGSLLGTGTWDSYPPGNTQIKTAGGINLELGVDADGLGNGIPSGDMHTFRISFASGGEFAFNDDTHLRWHSQSVGGPGGESIKCDTYFSDGGSFPGCQVVPEPITTVLLGTGLIGIGVGAIRRRRKGFDVADA